ncbi:hypothetical protein HZH66_010691 [Vespula vulgaris]|uniref:Uncharacterized protein n=1 Tax=Vespula vulgaris TaxID=7454 RepID=A0A834JGI6_VESVU|nr:hypothetical protein HZH66_010691 [Vespula vulgaris]
MGSCREQQNSSGGDGGDTWKQVSKQVNEKEGRPQFSGRENVERKRDDDIGRCNGEAWDTEKKMLGCCAV